MHRIRPSLRYTVRWHASLAGVLALLAVLCAMVGRAAFLPPAPVLAQATAPEVPRLQTQVTDLTNAQVLANGRAQIEAALTELRESRNVQLFVLFVESTGNLSVTEYADEVARRSSLGGNDALLVVALEDRSDALWRGAALRDRLTDDELEKVLAEQVEPLLMRGDFAGAAVAAADGLGEAAVADAGASGLPGGLSPVVVLVPLIGIPVVGIGGVWLWQTVATRRRQRQAAEAYARETEQLEQQANALLIATDEAVRDAEDEIRFAELQFDEAEVAPYREALASASKELQAAFALRQQLDDDGPEPPDGRRKLVEQIVEHAKRAKTLLDEQRQRIEDLREVERRAPEILAGLPAQLDALDARIPETERILSSLERYAEHSRASVMGNLEEAQSRLAEARSAVDAGQAALAEDDRSTAGRSARLGQMAQVDVTRLLDAVKSLAESLRQAEEASGPQVSAASADVSAARAAVGALEVSGRASRHLERRLVEAEDALAQARRELAAPRPDVLAAVRLATHADTIADQIMAQIRQDEERRARELRLLEAQLQTAEASYHRAANFGGVRRRDMGSAARTRLAEARRHLQQARALAHSDVQAALAEARRAQDLAEEAYALARQDFEAYSPDVGWSGGSRGGVFPIPFPVPSGGWSGGFGGGGFGGGDLGGGGFGSGEGGSVGGRW
jgi:uncharacterized membrane protein YgcG